MRRLHPFLALLLLASGCVIASTGGRHTNTQDGIWYVKKKPFSKADVYYCPPESMKCFKARIVEQDKPERALQLEPASLP